MMAGGLSLKIDISLIRRPSNFITQDFYLYLDQQQFGGNLKKSSLVGYVGFQRLRKSGAQKCRLSRAIPSASNLWHSPQTAESSHPALVIKRSGCGILPQVFWSRPWMAILSLSSLWHSPLTADSQYPAQVIKRFDYRISLRVSYSRLSISILSLSSPWHSPLMGDIQRLDQMIGQSGSGIPPQAHYSRPFTAIQTISGLLHSP